MSFLKMKTHLLNASDGIRTESGPEKVRVVLETGNPGNSDQSPVPS